MKKELIQIDLMVDGDGSVAYFYRSSSSLPSGLHRRYYRNPNGISDNASKIRFVRRVAAAQAALCTKLERKGEGES